MSVGSLSLLEGRWGHTMNHLFVPEPAQWGLRGDAYLWRELRTRGRKVPLPAELDEVSELLADMISVVLELSWDGLRGQEHVFHPSLAHGGMSSGHVHIATWRHRLIPLLLARAKALHEFSWGGSSGS
jgi:hypothetical protein